MPRPSDTSTANGAKKLRSYSASEIARNIQSFETWSAFQGCEEVSFHDLPPNIEADVTKVFDVTGQFPEEWLDKSSKVYKGMRRCMASDFLDFLDRAYKASPKLFSPAVLAAESKELLCDIQTVFSAWNRLQKMRQSSRKWSEADYVANVYNVFRSPAVREGDYRAQCAVALCQPLPSFEVTPQAVRILNAKTALPDASIFVPARLIRDLWHSAKSPFKILKSHKSVVKTGNVGGESSFRYQSTPCAKLSDTPSFEFASSYWEDKKPVHHLLEDAYRQNRMATTSAVRQLHSLHVQAPIFGLVWAQGTRIHSAAYPGPPPSARTRRTSGIFHEWNLDNPGDMLQVFLLIRNIDEWTVGPFVERIIKGVDHLLKDVKDGHQFMPWKRKGDLGRLVPTAAQENSNAATSTGKRKPARRRHRTS
ncbi:hypothetical protein A0H81_00990 [Grifola frondosa]|uniref:Uncharacterized protein n=1 Tax=Grifola frondosa TaxID=5627 RepID=A0A1C7MS51_GRIFR|nr:hypothetical protein A0H81_00990 [Grifola frondosa]